MRWIILILCIALGGKVWETHAMLGGLIQVFGIYYCTREFWNELFK